MNDVGANANFARRGIIYSIWHSEMNGVDALRHAVIFYIRWPQRNVVNSNVQRRMGQTTPSRLHDCPELFSTLDDY